MNFSLRQLRAFIAVAHHASFTKAAEQFHITQAGLSAMVRELEEQMQCRLFERTTRAVRLTPAGAHLLPIAQRTVRDLGDAAASLATLGSPRPDRLRVGVTPLIACSVIPEVLKRFRQRMPHVHVDVMDLDRALIQQHVQNGDLDAGFGAFFSRVSGVRRRVMFPSQLVLAMSHAARRNTPRIGWGDIDQAALISLPAENPIQKIVDRHLRASDTNPRGRQTVTHLETAMALVEAGLGQALMPSFAAVARKRWRVHFALVEPAVSLDYYCITRSGGPESELTGVFAGVFSSVAASHMQ
jgi:DNA-binding transcriptional LysR family regulator